MLTKFVRFECSFLGRSDVSRGTFITERKSGEALESDRSSRVGADLDEQETEDGATAEDEAQYRSRRAGSVAKKRGKAGNQTTKMGHPVQSKLGLRDETAGPSTRDWIGEANPITWSG